jgi:hypothetical protein
MLSIVVIGLAAFLTAFGLRAQQQQTSAHFAPFTATILESRYRADGTKRYEETITYAVRGDGSSVRAVRREVVKGAAFEIKEIINAARKARIIVDQATESTTSYKLSGQELVPPSCPIPANAETDTVLGYRVFKVTQKRTAPPDLSGTRETWIAPDLDCFAMKAVSTRIHAAGTAAPRNTRLVTDVRPGEPAPALFNVPAEYAERSPEQRTMILMNRFPALQIPADSAADDVYRLDKSPQK